MCYLFSGTIFFVILEVFFRNQGQKFSKDKQNLAREAGREREREQSRTQYMGNSGWRCWFTMFNEQPRRKKLPSFGSLGRVNCSLLHPAIIIDFCAVLFLPYRKFSRFVGGKTFLGNKNFFFLGSSRCLLQIRKNSLKKICGGKKKSRNN